MAIAQLYPSPSFTDTPGGRSSGAANAPVARTLALLLAGGRGTRLGGLTEQRAKPAVPMACRHRLIDFTLANCWHSGIPHVGVLTQHLSGSLEPHLRSHWGTASSSNGPYANCLRAPGGDDPTRGYRGTADAVWQNLGRIRAAAPSQVLVLAGDHAYRMDYGAMLAEHLQRGAHVTVGCIRVPLDAARAFGVMQVDADERICRFAEKPAHPEPIPGATDVALASMGIYLFDTAFLVELLAEDAAQTASTHDFGKEVIPAAVRRGHAHACSLRDPHNPLRQGYWRDVGTIDAYRQTNLEMAGESPLFDPEDDRWPVRPLTTPAQTPAAPRGDRSLVSADCRTRGAELSRCVLFPGVRIGARSLVRGTVALPGASIGARCVVQNAVIEEGCDIPAGTVIGVDADDDRRRFHVAPGGTVLVTPDMLARRGPAAPAPEHPPLHAARPEACCA